MTHDMIPIFVVLELPSVLLLLLCFGTYQDPKKLR
jgi:hypothetical protein